MTGHPETNRHFNPWPLLAGFLLALLCAAGIHFLFAPLFYLGMVGGLAMILVTGPHGDTSAAGYVLFVLVNTLTFWGLIVLGRTLVKGIGTRKA